ncbi:MAG: tryptophan synthase subunit beta [Candidatus Woesearchaeota archaeon]
MSKKYFGEYGGQYVPEKLMPYLNELEEEYENLKGTEFNKNFEKLCREFVGRPSPLYLAERLSDKAGCKVYLKREDLNHTGAHKINNTIGQALLAKEMGKTEIIAETGAGQHGVATATVAAMLDMKCKVFMGEKDTKKQLMNVYRMKLLGAEVVTVKTGGRVLKDAVDEAISYLVKNQKVFYLLGSVVGPHPYPTMVRDFQRIIGDEAKEQILEKEGKMPDYLVACVGGGSNAMGLFYPFLNDGIRMLAVEPAGKGLDTGEHAASLLKGTPGILHGFKSYLLQDEKGEPLEVHSIASGLDYPGVGPEHCMLKDQKKIIPVSVTDKEAIEGFKELCRLEGIIPALESSHAVAYVLKTEFKPEDIVILNLSGRGDKDVDTMMSI